MRSLLLFLAASLGLHATSLATATCMLGSETQTMTGATHASCSLIYPAPGNWYIGADASVQRSFAADGTVQYWNVFADAAAGVPETSPPASASASATDVEYFRSAGAPRAGLIAFVLQGFGNGGNLVSISDGVHQYSVACDYFSCSYNGEGPPIDSGDLLPGLVPFELGTTFRVSLSALAYGCDDPTGGCSQPGASVDFLQLFAADGTTAVSYLPVAVPEPGTLWLLAIPAAIYGFKRLR